MAKRMTIEEIYSPNRFKGKYTVNKVTGCWDWTGGKRRKNNYGVMFHREGDKKLSVAAHRMSYMIFISRQIPDGLMICHKCDNKGCINPDHLFAGTNQDNVDDFVKKGFKEATIPRGEKHQNTKLKNDTVANMKADLWGGQLSIRQVSEKYNVTMRTATNIKYGCTWGHIPAASLPSAQSTK